MEKEQKITLKIAKKDYTLKASSPEMEHYMRTAAEMIDKKIDAYDAKFPDKALVDKLAFVALNETIGRMAAQRKNADIESKIKQMVSETGEYLDSIEKNGR